MCPFHMLKCKQTEQTQHKGTCLEQQITTWQGAEDHYTCVLRAGCEGELAEWHVSGPNVWLSLACIGHLGVGTNAQNKRILVERQMEVELSAKLS